MKDSSICTNVVKFLPESAPLCKKEAALYSYQDIFIYIYAILFHFKAYKVAFILQNNFNNRFL